MRRTTTLVPAFAILLAACGPIEQAPEDSPPVLIGRQDLAIGMLDGPAAYLFGGIGGIAADPSGRILVADFQTHDVRVFAADGSHLFTFGGEGAGPGELRRPCCLAFAPGGVLWIRDDGNGRYSSFRIREGGAQFQRAIFRTHNFAGIFAPTTFDAAGHLVDVGQQMHQEPGLSDWIRNHVDSSGAVLATDTIVPPPAARIGLVMRRERHGYAVMYYWQPFGPRHLVAHGPGGHWATAISSAYRVEWRSPGEGTRIIERSVPEGPALSPREVEAAEARMEGYLQSGISRSDLPFGIPDRHPPLRDVYFDSTGRLWVELSVPDGADRRADVFNAEGRRVATYQWPGGIDLSFPAWVSPDFALGVKTDSLGVQQVARVRFSRT